MGCSGSRRASPSLIEREHVIWHKKNGIPEPVPDRTVNRHESWFHFVLDRDYFGDIDPLGEPYAPGSAERMASRLSASGFNVAPKRMGLGDARDEVAVAEADARGRPPESVWRLPTDTFRFPPEMDAGHHAAFPRAWPRRLTLGRSPPAGVVLDPFGGTGTTALAASALGRHRIPVDLSARYRELARWRIYESDDRRKALAATNGVKRRVEPVNKHRLSLL
jgi:DNA modification methylase